MYFPLKLHVLCRVHQVIQPVTGTLANGYISAVTNLHLPHSGFFRGNHDHPVRRLGTVNSRGRSVFQHRDCFYIIRVQPRDGISRQLFNIISIRGKFRVILRVKRLNIPLDYAIHYPYRFLTPQQSGSSPNSNLGCCPHLPCCVPY